MLIYDVQLNWKVESGYDLSIISVTIDSRSLVLTPPHLMKSLKWIEEAGFGNSLRRSHQIACPLCKYLGNVNSYSQFDFCAYVTLGCAQVRLCGLREKNLTNFPLVGLKNSKPLPTHQHTKMVGQLKSISSKTHKILKDLQQKYKPLKEIIVSDHFS